MAKTFWDRINIFEDTNNKPWYDDLAEYGLPALGAIGGLALGGIPGAAGGFALGRGVDKWLFPDTPQVRQASLGDLGDRRDRRSSRRERRRGRERERYDGRSAKRIRYEKPRGKIRNIQDSAYFDPLYNPQAFLGDLNMEKSRYRSKRDELETMAKDLAYSPSVVDAQLNKAYAQQQAALATAAAGRSGPGFLEFLQNQSALSHGRLADEGASLRLQEDLGRQAQLQQTLGQIQSRDQAFTGLLGNIYGQGMDDALSKYQMDTSKQLGLLAHNRALEQLALEKYRADMAQELGLAGQDLSQFKARSGVDLGYLGHDMRRDNLAFMQQLARDKFGLQKDAANPWSTQNILGNLGKVGGTETAQKWIDKGLNKLDDWIFGSKGGTNLLGQVPKSYATTA